MPLDRRTELRTLLHTAVPDVYDYLVVRCRNRTLAEDLTSETFLAAVDACGRRDVEPSVAWLIGIARHKLIDHWRRETREDRHLAALAGELVEEVIEVAFEPGPASDALALLNPMQRAALTLRYVDGLPVAAVAAEIGRGVHATETLLMRAKAAFRRRYRELCGGDDG